VKFDVLPEQDPGTKS